jgi:NAD(P)H-nitrite reductase large subunit
MIPVQMKNPEKNMLYMEDVLKAPLNEIVCYCSNITKGSIITAIQNGAHNLDDIKMITGACTIGKCKELSPRKR